MESLICTDRAAAGDVLRADCRRCKALCCILLPFDSDQGFGYSKAASVPCVNLAPDFTCRIHAQLEGQGFPGCARYDCHGAGQYVTSLLALADDWHESDLSLREVYDLFAATRALHARIKARRMRPDLPAAG